VAKILSISYDVSLLLTRHLLLERLGHTVHSAEGFARAFELCEHHDGRFDLIVLGHSIPHADKIAMINHCKNVCKCSVLALLRPNESPVPGADKSVDVADPQAFLAAVDDIVSRTVSKVG
jgi:CheY-like chemotaxis protein